MTVFFKLQRRGKAELESRRRQGNGKFPLCIATDIQERDTNRRGKSFVNPCTYIAPLSHISRGTAERVLELVQKALSPSSKL